MVQFRLCVEPAESPQFSARPLIGTTGLRQIRYNAARCGCHSRRSPTLSPGELAPLLALVAGALGQPLLVLVLDHAFGRVLRRVSKKFTASWRPAGATAGATSR